MLVGMGSGEWGILVPMVYVYCTFYGMIWSLTVTHSVYVILLGVNGADMHFKGLSSLPSINSLIQFMNNTYNVSWYT